MRKFLPLLLCLAVACKHQPEYNADLLVKNAVVYTVDDHFSIADAFVVSGGKIVAVGRTTPWKKHSCHARLLMPAARRFTRVL